VNFALAADTDELRLTPLQPGRFSVYERSLLAQVNLAALVNLIAPGVVHASWAALYTDPKLSLPKDWRDVYRHAPDGRPLGWRRYDHGRVTDFTADGLLVTETDRLGRPKAARQVEYLREDAKEGPEAMWAKMLYRPAGRTVRFTYAGDDDPVGKPEGPPKFPAVSLHNMVAGRAGSPTLRHLRGRTSSIRPHNYGTGKSRAVQDKKLVGDRAKVWCE
jgi:hypothetical protein